MIKLKSPNRLNKRTKRTIKQQRTWKNFRKLLGVNPKSPKEKSRVQTKAKRLTRNHKTPRKRCLLLSSKRKVIASLRPPTKCSHQKSKSTA